MKTYTKTHSEKKAFDGHISNIKSRGGEYSINGMTIEYSFPAKKGTKTTKTAKAKHNLTDELPADTEQEILAGKVTYRGTGTNGKHAGMTKLKVHGKEYLVSREKFKELGGIEKIRFSAPFRRER